MSESTEAKPTYIGLWAKPDKNGNTYLSGGTDDIAYTVFKDKDDAGKRQMNFLTKTDTNPSWTKGAVFSEVKKDDGTSFFKSGNMCIYLNDRRDEAKNHPHFNLVIYTEAQ